MSQRILGVSASIAFWLAAATALAAEDFQVNSYTPFHQTSPRLAMRANGDFVVVWLSSPAVPPGGTYAYITARRFAADGTPREEDFPVNVESNFPMADEPYDAYTRQNQQEFTIVWTELDTDTFYTSHRGKTLPFEGALADSQEQERNARGGPGIVTSWWNRHCNPNLCVSVWNQEDPLTTNPPPELRASSSLASSFVVENTVNASIGNGRVSATPEGEEFVVVWSDLTPLGSGGGRNLHARRYLADGTPLGSKFQVNVGTLGEKRPSALVHLADGSFVVGWTNATSADTDTSGTSLQARIFAPDGTPLGDDFQINTYTTGDQHGPLLAADPEGNFVAVWTSQGSPGTDTDGHSVQAQVFDGSGGRVGPEFQVNTFTAFNQFASSLASDGEGNYRVAWSGPGTSVGNASNEIWSSPRLSFAGLFADGFEDGDTSNWFNTVP